MPHSLRAKLSGLHYKGILEDKDYKRLCHALDLEKAEQEQKSGRWVDSSNGWMCSACNKDNTYDTNFCPNCGAKMFEPQETETWNGIHGQITAPRGTFKKIFDDAESEDKE